MSAKWKFTLAFALTLVLLVVVYFYVATVTSSSPVSLVKPEPQQMGEIHDVTVTEPPFEVATNSLSAVTNSTDLQRTTISHARPKYFVRASDIDTNSIHVCCLEEGTNINFAFTLQTTTNDVNQMVLLNPAHELVITFDHGSSLNLGTYLPYFEHDARRRLGLVFIFQSSEKTRQIHRSLLEGKNFVSGN